MSATPFRPKAYLKTDCPFSFKFLLFMAEAGLIDHIEVHRCDPAAANFERIKAELARGLGKPATFPTVELEPGRYRTESDELIAHFAKVHGVDRKSLTALDFYEKGILPQVVKLHELEKRA